MWNISLQIFVKLEQCASYQGSRQSLSRRQYAPNKQCALNNDVCLITQFYGIQVSIIAKSLSTKLIIIRRLYVCTVSSSFVPRPKEEEEEGPGFSSGSTSIYHDRSLCKLHCPTIFCAHGLVPGLKRRKRKGLVSAVRAYA